MRQGMASPAASTLLSTCAAVPRHATCMGIGALQAWPKIVCPGGQAESPFKLHAGVALTMLRFFGPSLARSGLVAPKLTAPFARIVDRVVTNPWLRQFLDLECFVLSGMLAKDTICAEVCSCTRMSSHPTVEDSSAKVQASRTNCL